MTQTKTPRELAAAQARIAELEQALSDTKELLPMQAHVARGGLSGDWWSVAIAQRRKRIAAQARNDALLKRADKLVDDLCAVESERDALKAERDALKAERDALKAERDALKAKLVG